VLQFENRTAPIVIGKSVPDRFLPFNRVLPVRDSHGEGACTGSAMSGVHGSCGSNFALPVLVFH